MEAIDKVKAKFVQVRNSIDIDALNANIADLSEKQNDPKVWNDHARANEINQKMSHDQKLLDKIISLEAQIRDLEAYSDLLSGGKDDELSDDLITALSSAQDDLDELEIETLFKDKYDVRGAYLQIRTGAGGVDAADFSSMLQRMYLRWGEIHKIDTKILETSFHEEAGIKSTTLEFNELYCYGKLKLESGTHRLVRQSPFNSAAKRQTSFSAVEVTPIIENDNEIEIDDKDIKIDVFHSSGPGGQSVNTTDSAVRITHIPSGIVVNQQDQKSQLQNKNKAMNVLKSKLLVLKIQQQAKEIDSITSKASASWGDQIRSYVLHPYKMIKDLRTNYETSNVDSVLDGDIDKFIEAEIRILA